MKRLLAIGALALGIGCASAQEVPTGFYAGIHEKAHYQDREDIAFESLHDFLTYHLKRAECTEDVFTGMYCDFPLKPKVKLSVLKGKTIGNGKIEAVRFYSSGNLDRSHDRATVIVSGWGSRDGNYLDSFEGGGFHHSYWTAEVDVDMERERILGTRMEFYTDNGPLQVENMVDVREFGIYGVKGLSFMR